VKQKIPIAEPEIGEEELRNVTEAVKSGWVSSKGPFIEEFEHSFSKYIRTEYGIATSNGTTALHLALVSLGIGKGDKVLIPSLDFISVANAVTYTGAEPIFLDSHPEYWCIDPSQIVERINKQTKAIIAVHLYGHPCDMDKIVKIASDYDLYLLEDCAEAHGAEYKNRKTGSFGIISCFSFYGNKIITTGEGGMCLTDDRKLSEKMKILRDHGMNPDRKYWHDVIGFNYRMTNLQAAIGVAQLQKIDHIIDSKRRIARLYSDHLKELPSVTPAPEMPWAKSVYWLYSVLVEESLRNNLMDLFEKQGIEVRPFFYPSHTLPPYASNLHLHVAEELSKKGINLPSGFRLTENHVRRITDLMGEVLNNF
jgi:perosamine synthetase